MTEQAQAEHGTPKKDFPKWIEKFGVHPGAGEVSQAGRGAGEANAPAVTATSANETQTEPEKTPKEKFQGLLNRWHHVLHGGAIAEFEKFMHDHL